MLKKVFGNQIIGIRKEKHALNDVTPIKGKTYEIDYYDANKRKLSYSGIGECLGESGEVDGEGRILYSFKLPNNICHASFCEEDIISVHK